MKVNKELVAQNGSQSGAVLGELTGGELFAQNGNQAGSAMGELTDDELLAQNGNQAGVGVAEYFDELDKRPKCLTFTAIGGRKSDVGFIVHFDYEQLPETYTKPLLQYSIDGGETWQDYDLQISNVTEDATPIEIAEGESVMFKGVNENLAYYFEEKNGWLYVQACISGSVAASGDVTSLLNGEGGDVVVPQFCFFGMFSGCTGLTQAPALPATTLAESCYRGMFSGCTGLTQAPALPATTLAESCYSGMFSECTGLTQAPALPATTLAESCYSGMFSGCTGITSHDVATLNNSKNVFRDNTACVSLAIHAETPPAIAGSTIEGLKADCVIYVPAASVNAYIGARYWSDRRRYIQAIP